MQGRTARKVLDVWRAVEPELVKDVERVVLYGVKIAVVTVARHGIAVLPVPFGVLHAYVFRRYHLAVEHHVLGAVGLVVLLYYAEHALHEGEVAGVVVDFKAEELGGLHQTVDAYGEILAPDVDVTGVKQRQQTGALQFFQVLVVSQLHLVNKVGDARKELLIVNAVVHGVLHAAVEVDRKHALRAS